MFRIAHSFKWDHIPSYFFFNWIGSLFLNFCSMDECLNSVVLWILWSPKSQNQQQQWFWSNHYPNINQIEETHQNDRKSGKKNLLQQNTHCKINSANICGGKWIGNVSHGILQTRVCPKQNSASACKVHSATVPENKVFFHGDRVFFIKSRLSNPLILDNNI